MSEKKYKKKKYPYLDKVVDAIDNTNQKRYDIKRLLKRYIDKMQNEVSTIMSDIKAERLKKRSKKKNVNVAALKL